MKKIHFHNLNSKFNIAIGISLIAVLLLSFLPVIESFIKPSKLRSIFFILNGIFYFRLILWRNRVAYNKKSIRIKINSFLSKLVEFKDVRSINYNDSFLTIVMFRRNTLNIDISGIDKTDVAKLEDLIKLRIQEPGNA